MYDDDGLRAGFGGFQIVCALYRIYLYGVSVWVYAIKLWANMNNPLMMINYLKTSS